MRTNKLTPYGRRRMGVKPSVEKPAYGGINIPKPNFKTIEELEKEKKEQNK